MSLIPKDMTPVYKATIGKGTGGRRWQRPIYVDHLPPCNNACPAGENIQAWLDLAQAGDYEEAWRKYMEENPLPGTHGRACYHPCESACNRQYLDQPVSIHSLDRFLGDLANEKGWTIRVEPPTGKRVLVVGAGPARLVVRLSPAALGPRGRNPRRQPGARRDDALRHSRLPPAARRPHEGDRAHRGDGREDHPQHRVTDVLAEKEAGKFDAVFLAIGAQVANHLDIPAMDGGKMIDAVTLLEQVEQGRAPRLGRVVGIVGGGNTAMDAARIAKRLGAEEAVLIFRFDKAHMEAHPYEAMEAFAEGVKIKWLSTVKQFGERRDHGGADGDGAGRFRLRRHRTVPTLKADSLVLAVGQHADVEFLKNVAGIKIGRGNVVEVDAHMRAGRRHLCRRRHDRRRAHHDGGRRPRQEGGAQHRCLAARRRLPKAGGASAIVLRRCST